MIIGIGNDLVDIRRIEAVINRFGARFEERCFTPEECMKAARREKGGTKAHVLAKRFAAKEACAKALGTGFSNSVVMKDIGISEDESGRPYLTLKNGALEKLNNIVPKGMTPHLHVSLSDEPPMAQAFVIIEACP